MMSRRDIHKIFLRATRRAEKAWHRALLDMYGSLEGSSNKARYEEANNRIKQAQLAINEAEYIYMERLFLFNLRKEKSKR